MEKTALKKKIFETCYQIQRNKVKQIETIMAEAQESANEDEQTKDLFDASREMLINKRDMYAQQLETELQLIDILNRVDLSLDYKTVSFGSVILTDEQKIFICIGLGKFTVENDIYYAISTKVPFFEVLKGKKKGDTIDFRGKKIMIRDIF